MNKKAQLIENWGLFSILYGVGIATMMIMLMVWKTMEYEIGLFMKMVIVLVVPAIAAIFFTYRLENS